MIGELVLVIRNSRTGHIMGDPIVLGKNVITTGLKTQTCHLLGGDYTDRSIDRMQFGSGTLTPSAADSTLQMPITPTKAVNVSYPWAAPNDYVVQFQAFIQRDECNGFPIAEAGLLCENDTLATRKTFSQHQKTSDYVFEFRWRIQC